MKQDRYHVIGVMSGTSLDGVDLAHIYFTIENKKWNFTILASETVRYSNTWITNLKQAVDFSKPELDNLNQYYTKLLGQIITDFIQKNKIETLDAVCSHGHTILHQPQNGFTLQIGNLPEIATLTEQNIVCDFRVQDVKMGGQGAPLVPIGDQILFSEYDFCLNLGGFSNISFEVKGKRIAFDISPVNTVLNTFANRLGFEYDDKGKMARTGKINTALIAELNALEYYQKPYPKSLGYEFVKTSILPILEKYDLSIEDKTATFVEHIAQQTAFVIPNHKCKMLITGGGAYHDFLIERIQFYKPEIQITIPDTTLLEYKEALIFGLLGVLKLRNEINVLSSVTGAKKDHSTGKIYFKSV